MHLAILALLLCVVVLQILNLMKTSETKAIVAAAAKKSVEAFAEISARIADQQKQIDSLLSGATDPEVTDEQFIADLNTLKTTTDQLADIVPAPTPAPTP